MSRFSFFVFCSLLVVFSFASSVDARANRQCPILPTDPIGKTVEEMAERSSDIFLATAVSYSPSEELMPHLGIYTMDVLRVIKNEAEPSVKRGQVEIVGIAPYEAVPQSYLDATERHERNRERFIPGHFNKTIVNGRCRPFFRGLISYNYLVFLEGGEFAAFEVVNDISHDAMLLRVDATQQ